MGQTLTGLMAVEIAEKLGVKPFQGKQIFKWLHLKMVRDFDAMTDLSKALRETLKENYEVRQLALVEMEQSERTGTKKALLRLADGETVECVLIRGADRITLCLSSQVGCALKCTFCATGLAGFTRDLTPDEIVEQALFLLEDEDMEGRTPNIVYMGMGEPLRNTENVIKSIKLLMDKNGLGIGARKISVSTAGELKGIRLFAQEDWQVRLSISLHAANDDLRSKLVPLNRKYSLEQLKETLLAYQADSGRQITFEWTLLDGVNDSKRDFDELMEYRKGLKASVNLIPWNPVADLPYGTSRPDKCEAFRDRLLEAGVQATLRVEKGRDIDAACGQLRRTHAAVK